MTLLDEGLAIWGGTAVAAAGLLLASFHYRADKRRKEKAKLEAVAAEQKCQAEALVRHMALQDVLVQDVIGQVKVGLYLASAVAVWLGDKLPLPLRPARLICPSSTVWDALSVEFRANEPDPAALAETVRFYTNVDRITTIFDELEKQTNGSATPGSLPANAIAACLELLGKLLMQETSATRIVERIGNDEHRTRLAAVSERAVSIGANVGKMLAAKGPAPPKEP